MPPDIHLNYIYTYNVSLVCVEQLRTTVGRYALLIKDCVDIRNACKILRGREDTINDHSREKALRAIDSLSLRKEGNDIVALELRAIECLQDLERNEEPITEGYKKFKMKAALAGEVPAWAINALESLPLVDWWPQIAVWQQAGSSER